VVPAEEVEEAVREEHGDLLENGHLVRTSLLPGGWNAHNDVAEEVAGQLTELALVHREGKNVRRTILAAIGLVQLMHAFVIG
jgi:hypothetical protein